MGKNLIGDLEDKIFELDKRLESKHQETRDLANIASVITSLMNIESVLAAAMEIGIRQVSSEVGAVLEIIEDEPRLQVSWGVEAALLDSLIYKENLDIVRYCWKYKKTIYENSRQRLFYENVSIRNFICTPILSREKVFGIMVIFNKESEDGFTEKDILILEMICKFASVAIENSKLLKESLKKQKIEQELSLARQVQATFLPENIDIDGLQIAATYIPAGQVGGDYYDLIPISDNKLFFLIGDVTSKGVPAALVMTSVHSIVRAFIASGESIQVKDFMSLLNDVLCKDVIKNHSMFITLFMAFIDLENSVLEYCNGGHPPPFYYRSATGETVPLKCGGPIVGQFAGSLYKSRKIDINRSDRIFCYTDGLFEATDRGGNLFGLERLEQFFQDSVALGAEQFSRQVKRKIEGFSCEGNVEAIDDYTTLVIDIAGPAAPKSAFNFIYDSCLDSLEKMHEDIDSIIQLNNIADKAAQPFRVAVSEAITNAIVHAHEGDSSKKIRFTVDLNEERIVAVISDEGANQGIISMDCADPAGPPEAEGGRGLGLIKKLSDEASLEYLPRGGTAVKIVKNLNEWRSNGG